MPLRARSSAPLREGYRARQAIAVPGVLAARVGLYITTGGVVGAVGGLERPSWRRARW
jgi:hypothetical protein